MLPIVFHECSSLRDSHRFQMAAWEVIRPKICVATLHPEPPTVSHCPWWFCVRGCLERLGPSRDAAGLVLELVRAKISVKELECRRRQDCVWECRPKLLSVRVQGGALGVPKWSSTHGMVQ